MQILSFYELNFSQKEEWFTFVSEHKNGNIFQSPILFEFYRVVKNHEPIVFFAYVEGKLVGVLCAVIVNEDGVVKRYFSRRCIVTGGPITSPENDVEIAQALLNALNNAVESKAIYTQIRNLFNVSSEITREFKKCGYAYEDHLNILVNLEQSEEVLWSQVHSKRRNEIRRGEKEGTTIRLAETEEELIETYNILQEVYARARLPLPESDYFLKIYHMDNNKYFRVFVAVNSGRIIGTMYTFCFMNRIYDWYAGSYQKFYNKYPNDVLPWKVFLWGKGQNYSIFDFGGAGKPDVPYGVRDYKRKFGGEMINFGRFEKINKKGIFIISKNGFLIYQKLNKIKNSILQMILN